MANGLYNKFLQALGNGEVDLGAGTFKIALLSASYTPDLTDSGDEFESDLVGKLDEIDLVNPTWVNRVFDADNLVGIFPDNTVGTGTQLVLYKDTGTPATSNLIAYYDTVVGLPIIQDGIDDTITFAAGGLFKLGS